MASATSRSKRYRGTTSTGSVDAQRRAEHLLRAHVDGDPLGQLVEGAAGLAVRLDGGDRLALVAAGAQRRDERQLGEQWHVELGGQLGAAAGPEDLVAHAVVAG